MTRLISPSGNVFRDAGFDNPEELLAKQQAVEFLREQLHATGMTETQLAERSGLEQAHVSEMLSGRLARFGVGRLNRALAVFGASIEDGNRRTAP